MASFEKHRNERETYEYDFARRLVSGETLSAPEVTVTQEVAGMTVDRSAQFVDGVPVIATTRVQFTMKAGAAGQQLRGDYTVYVKASTSSGRILVGTAPLGVSAVGVV